MFADFSPDSEWSRHSNRGWTTLISFALQVLAVACLLLLPLLYNEGLPRLCLKPLCAHRTNPTECHKPADRRCQSTRAK